MLTFNLKTTCFTVKTLKEFFCCRIYFCQLDSKYPYKKGVTRALIRGRGGGCIFIYSCFARRISLEIKFISKEFSRAEHDHINIYPSINALVTHCHIINRTLHGRSKIWILCSRGKNNALTLFLSLEHNIHILSPPYNILYILKRIETSMLFIAKDIKKSL